MLSRSEASLCHQAYTGSPYSAPATLLALALELEAFGAAAIDETDEGAQGTFVREFVHDALRGIVARVLEHGARGAELREHKLSRRTATGLSDVN